ncbi:MAG TPA: valine--tRNA ligase [Planctomycetota bacterium]|nr:valine--tRNA ligase [Planctomycetota bacterium]
MSDQIKNADDFPSQYDPRSFEEPIYTKWEQNGAFHSEPDPAKKPYTISIPPPNVTGVLHIGHALNNTLQDVLTRWRRMEGYETLWLPGMDHAGIATQNVVEKQIAINEKKTRYQLGRAELIRRIWEWKEQSGGTILKQLRKLGATCDWQRTRFTMDDGLSKAVRHAFFRLHEKGLIYRGKYLINWCPRCRTTLSDDEVEHEDVKGKLYELHYPLSDGSGKLTVATTRPETMLGDTAVAVHPDDERYKQFVGKFVDLPLTGRKIPVIADSALELGFGTGCLKVTPAHDPVDYQIGQRHKLPLINILTDSGAMNENCPEKYRGLDRFKARTQIVEDLKAMGLVGDVKDHPQKVGHCYRCNNIIEPFLKAQWFVKMKPLSEMAVKATAEGRVTFHPERWTKVYLKWFEEVRDWPISRQIWWGHQIPVWYDLDENKDCITTIEAGPDEPYDLEKDGKRFRYIIGENAKPIVAMEDPSSLPEYKNRNLLRDPDVLDTWFSSALWPFSTLGWPEKTADLDYYYPTSTLVTSRGIIYFWVARMVMMGECMLGKQPFRDVVIHGTVLDGDGKVMSKSKGNGIDPLDIIHRYGADAMRYTLADMSTGGQDLKFPVQIVCPHCDELQDLPAKLTQAKMSCKKCKKEFQRPVPFTAPLPDVPMGPLDSARFEKGRNFANKVWNAGRFVLTSIPAGAGKELSHEALTAAMRAEDKWILSRLNSTVREVTAALEGFEFSKAIGTLYDFFWNEFCSWYIELSKPRLSAIGAGNPNSANDSAAAKAVLLYTIDRSLRLLHPFCPYVTEALWGELGKRATAFERNLNRGEYEGSTGRQKGEALLISAPWPKAETKLINQALEEEFASTFETVIAVRAVRQELIDNSPKDRKKEVSAVLARPFKVAVRTNDATLAERLKSQAHILTQMSNIETPEIGTSIAPPKPASATGIKGGTIYVALSADLVDVERLRLGKEISKAEQFIPKVEAKLKNENFIRNAPPELVAEEREKLKEVQSKLGTLKAALAELG